jgi:hypothetical protein
MSVPTNSGSAFLDGYARQINALRRILVPRPLTIKLWGQSGTIAGDPRCRKREVDDRHSITREG